MNFLIMLINIVLHWERKLKHWAKSPLTITMIQAKYNCCQKLPLSLCLNRDICTWPSRTGNKDLYFLCNTIWRYIINKSILYYLYCCIIGYLNIYFCYIVIFIILPFPDNKMFNTKFFTVTKTFWFQIY